MKKYCVECGKEVKMYSGEEGNCFNCNKRVKVKINPEELPRCKFCDSNRLAYINVKGGDTCIFKYKGKEYEGSAPHDLGFEGGNYLEIDYCLECGRIQSEFPIPEAIVEKVWEEEEEVEDEEDN